jgi:deoxyribonuclease V
MLLAFDTYYFSNKAKTVCLEFEEWSQAKDYIVHSEILDGISEYVSGEFYKRELPCIISLLKKINIENVDAIIIDGFVFLDDAGKLGLGGHLYEALDRKIPIIGVAKTNFATIEKHKRLLVRGESARPLFITAIGMDVDLALKYVTSMHGEFRIPTLLKQLDMLTKEIDQ